jgi:hypothetical protein
MPIYIYKFSTPDGDRTVERVFPMSSYPQEITVQEGDEVYTAKLTPALTARMAGNWAVKNMASDLPPENHPEIKSPGQP